MPAASTILRKLITVFNPGIGSQYILQKSVKSEISQKRAAIPILWVLSQMSDNHNDTEN